MQIDADYFEEKMGVPPDHDDLDRVNCPYTGNLGHENCGWCRVHDLPRFSCTCRAFNVMKEPRREL